MFYLMGLDKPLLRSISTQILSKVNSSFFVISRSLSLLFQDQYFFIFQSYFLFSLEPYGARK